MPRVDPEVRRLTSGKAWRRASTPRRASTRRDFELHLIKPGGRINDPATDCTWNTCVSRSPDWGVAGDASDDPKKDVDDTGDCTNFDCTGSWSSGCTAPLPPR